MVQKYGVKKRLHFDIIKSMIRYWHRQENLDSNFTLLKDAYEE
jgi:hypothetical protein